MLAELLFRFLLDAHASLLANPYSQADEDEGRTFPERPLCKVRLGDLVGNQILTTTCKQEGSP